MLISGKFANKKKRMVEFLKDRIAEKKALRLESAFLAWAFVFGENTS